MRDLFFFFTTLFMLSLSSWAARIFLLCPLGRCGLLAEASKGTDDAQQQNWDVLDDQGDSQYKTLRPSCQSCAPLNMDSSNLSRTSLGPLLVYAPSPHQNSATLAFLRDGEGRLTVFAGCLAVSLASDSLRDSVPGKCSGHC